MGRYVALGSFGTIIFLNIIIMVITSVYSPLSGEAQEECEGVASFACGTPVQALAQSLEGAKDFDLGGLVTLIPSSVKTLFGFLILDYDVLKGDGLAGGFGFIIRALGWTMLLGVILGLAAQVLGR